MEAPLLWFCDAIYVPLRRLLGVSRRVAVIGCVLGMTFASALSVINATGHRLFLGWLNAGLLILWIGLLAFNEWGPLSVVTTTGHRKAPPVTWFDGVMWIMMLGFWAAEIGSMFTSSGPLNLPGPYWWFLTARGFQSLDDDDHGEPLVRRLWNKVTSTIDSLTPSTVGAS